MNASPPPTCPRCGYDQSGVAESWKDQCPLTSVCAECGLDLVWSRVFDPREADVPWSAEHAQSRRQAIKRMPRNAMLLAYPNAYWRKMPIDAPLRIRRLISNAVVLVVVFYLLTSLHMMYEQWNGVASRWSPTPYQHYQVTGTGGLAAMLLNPFTVPVLEFDEIRGATVLDLVFYKQSWDWGQNHWGNSVHFSIPTSSIGSTDTLIFGFVILGVIPVVWSVILGVLHTTRKSANIGASHIARAVILNLTVAALMVVYIRYMSGIIEYRRAQNYRLVFASPVLIYLVWSLLFWPSAIIVGWRIKHARVLSVLGTVAAIVGTVLITLFFEIVV